MVVLPSGQAKAETRTLSAGSSVAGESPLGLYVHVPFCATTCDFCAFYQTVPKADAVPRYLESIEREAALVEWGAQPDGAPRRINTVFWGGGTPGLLRPGELERLGRAVLARANGTPEEWTVELAPATVTADRLAALKGLGVTRVSMGVQSFQPGLLEALGRQHTVEQIRRAWELIRGTGFASVNLDLMFALPGQTPEQWRADLDEAVRLAPDHLSTYCLTFEEDTALWLKLSQGQVKLDADKEAEFYLRTWEYLAEAGYAQYEVSNFARAGHVCRHNLNTWRMHEWVGLGTIGCLATCRLARRQSARPHPMAGGRLCGSPRHFRSHAVDARPAGRGQRDFWPAHERGRFAAGTAPALSRAAVGTLSRPAAATFTRRPAARYAGRPHRAHAARPAAR